MTSNRSKGNRFEVDFCNTLYRNYGYWVHRVTQNRDGQPADVIAIRQGKAHLIDCKVCDNNTFHLSRIEPNQETAMLGWEKRAGETAWFALKLKDDSVVMLSYDYLRYCSRRTLNEEVIRGHGVPLEEWVMK